MSFEDFGPQLCGNHYNCEEPFCEGDGPCNNYMSLDEYHFNCKNDNNKKRIAKVKFKGIEQFDYFPVFTRDLGEAKESVKKYIDDEIANTDGETPLSKYLGMDFDIVDITPEKKDF
ncbi:hypothetical protein MWH25_09295 [Natroniella acetigena]|uniref:hypothetical protein n=1 Tax=Natroniella acetigena TaxID=52004 RepID=UPI00200B9772|nr:hypothetical protein [Natroniella acetigena]MCK8827932.1 hypothetical protein [Natroniella acetigena]